MHRREFLKLPLAAAIGSVVGFKAEDPLIIYIGTEVNPVEITSENFGDFLHHMEKVVSQQLGVPKHLRRGDP